MRHYRKRLENKFPHVKNMGNFFYVFYNLEESDSRLFRENCMKSLTKQAKEMNNTSLKQLLMPTGSFSSH